MRRRHVRCSVYYAYGTQYSLLTWMTLNLGCWYLADHVVNRFFDFCCEIIPLIPSISTTVFAWNGILLAESPNVNLTIVQTFTSVFHEPPYAQATCADCDINQLAGGTIDVKSKQSKRTCIIPTNDPSVRSAQKILVPTSIFTANHLSLPSSHNIPKPSRLLFVFDRFIFGLFDRGFVLLLSRNMFLNKVDGYGIEHERQTLYYCHYATGNVDSVPLSKRSVTWGLCVSMRPI